MLRFRRLVQDETLDSEPGYEDGAAGVELSLVATQRGRYVTVQAETAITEDVYFHWYLDGLYAGVTRTPHFGYLLPLDDSAFVQCLATLYPDFDPIAAAPAGYPSRGTLQWIRSSAMNIGYYRVDSATGAGVPAGGDWKEIARFVADDRWHYTYLTPSRSDLTWYWYRVVPVDTAGNDGTALTFGPFYVVRRPNPPDFATSYDAGTGRVTWSAA